jgi:hypothetical protein
MDGDCGMTVVPRLRVEVTLRVKTMSNWLVAVNSYGYGITPGRLASLVAGGVGLTSVVIGGLALARSAGHIGTGTGRRGAVVAIVVGLIGTALGGLHLAASTGGFGTGKGRLGAIVAMAVGLIGMALGGLALARSRRTG